MNRWWYDRTVMKLRAHPAVARIEELDGGLVVHIADDAKRSDAANVLGIAVRAGPGMGLSDVFVSESEREIWMCESPA